MSDSIKISIVIIVSILTLIGGGMILSKTSESFKRKKKVDKSGSRLKENEAKANLIGHWHLNRTDSKKGGLIDDLLTIDFENDTIAVLGKYQGGLGGIGGWHDSENKTIKFGGECFAVYFKYTIENDKLRLVQEHYDDESEYFSAIRCEGVCCNKQDEYFNGLNIDIDLPVHHKANCITLEKKSLEDRLYVAMPKETLREEYGSDYKLVLGGKFSGIADLKLWEENHKIKLPESMRESVYKVIYSDKDTPVQELMPVLNYFRVNQEENVFFALRKEEMKNGLTICHKKVALNISVAQSDREKKVSTWLKEMN